MLCLFILLMLFTLFSLVLSNKVWLETQDGLKKLHDHPNLTATFIVTSCW